MRIIHQWQPRPGESVNVNGVGYQITDVKITWTGDETVTHVAGVNGSDDIEVTLRQRFEAPARGSCGESSA